MATESKSMDVDSGKDKEEKRPEDEFKGAKTHTDLSDTVSRDLPEIIAMGRSGDLPGATDRLLALEKKTRTAGDSISTSKVAVQLVKLCYELKDLKALNTSLLVIAKRRGQLKQVLSDVVTEAMTYTEHLDKADKIELITTLRTVTEGKIYVEVERARLTRQLATIKEADGKLTEASEVLQEVAVETFGSMDRREKLEFLLEQVRLTLATRDFVKMGILSNKVNRKQLDEAGLEDLRLAFYALLAHLHQQQHDALALAKDYQALASTRGHAEDAAKWVPALQAVVVYLALAPWDNEVSDWLHRLRADKRLEEAPMAASKALVDWLTTHEIVPWPLPEPHHAAIAAHEAFTSAQPGRGDGASASAAGSMELDTATAAAASSSSASSSAAAAPRAGAGLHRGSLTRKEDEARTPWLPILQKRVVQHNVRVAAKWYARVTTPRLAALLAIDAATAEAVVSELAADKALYAKIDRPAGIVVFQRPRMAEEELSDWAADIDTVLNLVEKTTHLIQKEYLVRGAVAPGAR